MKLNHETFNYTTFRVITCSVHANSVTRAAPSIYFVNAFRKAAPCLINSIDPLRFYGFPQFSVPDFAF